MRLFVAVELSEDMKKKITGTMHELKKKGVKGNYVPAQNLHLTLAFIGERDDPGAVKDALKAVSFKPFKLSLSDMGSFGNLIWVGMKGNQGLSKTAKGVRDALDAASIDYDRKKFTPHITIIRKASGNWKQVPAPKGDMMVKKISLMKTTFRDGKPVYTEVGAVESD
ncbi:MAG: RNA 2',3'-cyclic phosphodiesterase [Eubacterium sp.]|nr:RNA 2',3'-cyclic phosphodiesterase [Eubacterium sp.]